MTAGFGRIYRKNLLDWTFGKGSPSTPAGVVWLSLHTGDPGDDASNAAATEPTIGTNGYVRLACTASTWVAATTANPSVTTDAALINFAVSTGAWASGASLTYIAMWTASTGVVEATYVWRAPITTPQAVTATNQQITLAASALNITGIPT